MQCTTAIIRFVQNEIKVFGHYFDEFEDTTDLHQGVKVNINQLPTRKDVLQWYYELNAGGTPHTEEELSRVLQIIKEEKEKR